MEHLLARDRFDNYLYKMTPEPVSAGDVVCGSFLGPNNKRKPENEQQVHGLQETFKMGTPFVRRARVPFTGQQTIA
jgi:hypothetical protein